MKHRILVLRFSAFGDVAMTIPVIREFIQQNPNVEIIYVSREKFKDLFDDIPNFTFYPADLDGKHKGILGLYRLSKELKSLGITEVADLHNRSEEHTSELQSRGHLVCRLLLEKKKKSSPNV